MVYHLCRVDQEMLEPLNKSQKKPPWIVLPVQPGQRAVLPVGKQVKPWVKEQMFYLSQQQVTDFSALSLNMIGTHLLLGQE